MCAGEPLSTASTASEFWVYPRVCGGTSKARRGRSGRKGLSPCVRGNRCCRPWRSSRRRSIPVCAGEPSVNNCTPVASPVYPRVCGGTPHGQIGSASWTGLSPCVRGNLGAASHRRAGPRSIPVCAGEPGPNDLVSAWSEVYPRVCGGTPITGARLSASSGLSPCVRGNPQEAVVGVGGVRSIPVCAGEPDGGDSPGDQRGVYPRVCGGTDVVHNLLFASEGLSPCVRGNPIALDLLNRNVGSIPVCAGEPST